MKIIILLSLFLISVVTFVGANGKENNSSISVIDRTIFRSGDKIVIDGTIKGDLYAAGRTIIVNGKIEGDLFGAANAVVINGEIEGDIRTAAQTVRINGVVGKNGLIFAQTVMLTPQSRVGGELFNFSQDLLMTGTIGKHFQGAGKTIEINGTINGDAKIFDVEELIIHPGATISGALDYESEQKGNIADGTVQGTIQFEQKEEPQEQEKQEKQEQPWYIPGFGMWFSLISMLLLWLVLRFSFKNAVNTIEQNLNQPLLKTVSIGILSYIAIPIITFILLITVFGIPIAIITVLLFVILLYVGKVFIGIWIGRMFMKKLNWNGPVMLQELAGLILIFILTQLPFIGWLFSFVLSAFFIGAVFSALWIKKTAEIE